MSATFTITASYKNQEKNYDATLVTFGYSYRIEVMIDGGKVFFEPDEEKNYRACLPAAAGREHLPDPLLLQAIAAALEKAFSQPN